MRACRGHGLHLRFSEVNRTVLGKPAREGESPIGENGRAQTGMRAFRGSDRVIDLISLAEWFWESQPERVKAP